MYKKYLIRNVFVALCFLITLTSAVMYESGASGGYSNAPGENNCTSCHTGTLITSGNSNLNNIRLNPGFKKGGYEIDSTYTMELTFKQSGIACFGFEITCLNSSSNLAEGTFTTSNNRVRKTTYYVSGKQRQYVVQTTTGSAPVATDSTRWVFTWKAPSSNVGKVKFYVTMNAADNDGKEYGDKIYAKTFEFACASQLSEATAYTNDSVTCTNYSVNFTGSATNSPISYAWKFTGANPSTSNQQNPTAKFYLPGKQYAILTASNSSGPGRPDTMVIQVNQSPGASILNGYSATICAGDSMQISANSGSVWYLWYPGGQTSRSIFVKQAGNYFVTNTSASNGCKGTSASFQLNNYPSPNISIAGKNKNDTICSKYTDTLTATGNNIDSTIWYVNGQLYARKKGNTLAINVNSNADITAKARSTDGCLSVLSNSIKKILVPEILPYNYHVSKTSSIVHLGWLNRAGSDSVHYAVNNSAFKRSFNDTAVDLNNLTSNTYYNITLRTFQKTPCLYRDTVISVRTNNCSGLVYEIKSDPRVCKGDMVTIQINGLYKTQYSVSFQGSSYTKDTMYSILAKQSDSFAIVIIDSLNSSCPPIFDKTLYVVDTLPKEKMIPSIVYSCSNEFLFSRDGVFDAYSFYKNASLLKNGQDNSYHYMNLSFGDTLKSIANAGACESKQETVFMQNTSYQTDYAYTRDKTIYTCVAKDSNAVAYKWYLNGTLISLVNPVSIDMQTYSTQEVTVALRTEDATTCSDSISKKIQIPDLTSIRSLSSSELRVYPNPTSGHLNVLVSIPGDYQFTLMSIDGRSIASGTFSESLNIDLNGYDSGLYILKLWDEKTMTYRQVVLESK